MKDFSQKYAVRDNQDWQCVPLVFQLSYISSKKNNLEKINMEKHLNLLDENLSSIL